MVQDARVNHHLARLGGVYRDPARVNRDASTLLKSSVGTHLQPIAAVYADVGTTNGNSSSSTVLVLQGTIAIHFRGNTYQLLIDIYLVPGYPIRPPVCYVRLADSTMYLKQNHKHVGSDGKVYLPYLSEWSASTHNLVELVVAMSSVFSAEPPVFSRPTPPPPVAVSLPSSTTPPRTNSPIRSDRIAYSTSMNGTSTVSIPHARATTMGGSDIMTVNEMQQLEEMLAREAAEANSAIEAARRAEIEERQREEALQIQKQWEDAKLHEIRSIAQQKVRQHIVEIANKIQTNVRQDWKDSEMLNLSSNNKVNYQHELFTKVRDQLMAQTSTVSTKLQNIEQWLDAEKKKNHSSAAEPNTNTTTNTVTKDTINTIVTTPSPIDQQMLDLACENASYQDVLYNLDRLLLSGCIDCTTHLKYIRKVAKDQFYSRALLIKIQQKKQHLQFRNQNQNQQPW